MARTRSLSKTNEKDKKDKQKKVRCRDCGNEIRDTDGISFRLSDHSFFMCCCKKGHHINEHGKLQKLFIDHERICNDYQSKGTENE